jgi:hypothetical protein
LNCSPTCMKTHGLARAFVFRCLDIIVLLHQSVEQISPRV